MIVIVQALLCVTALVFAGLWFVEYWQSKSIKETLRQAGIVKTVVLVMFVGAAIYVGGSKSVITIDDYLVNAGSYITNDYVHVAITKASDIIPDSTEILVYARDINSSNAEDWVQFTPTYTLAEHPHDYAKENATNYNYLVVANFAPTPTVHTNGVWQAKGFWISSRTNTAGFANSRIKTKE